ncbi:hypothetical protein D3C72_1016940 [compost metagenome]
MWRPLLVTAAIALGATAGSALAAPAVTYTLPNPWTAPVLPPEEGSTVVGVGAGEATRLTDQSARWRATLATGYAGASFPFGSSLGYVMAGETGRGIGVGLGQVGLDAVVGLVGYQMAVEAIRMRPPGPVDTSLITVFAYVIGPVVLANTIYSVVAAWDVYRLGVWDPAPAPVTP